MVETRHSLLTTFLTDHDQPCPQCDYNLRNLQGSRCPECGEELALRVNAAESRQKLLIAGLIGLSAGAGLNGLLLIYGCIQLLRNLYSGDSRFWDTCGIGFVVEGGIIYLWLKHWRSIRRKQTSSRAMLAAACWVLTLVDLLIFSFTIR